MGEDQIQQQEGSFSKGFSSSESSLTSTTQYGGLIDIPISTQIKNAMIVVNSHIDQITPHWNTLHFIVSLLRFVQLIGPAFFPNDNMIYTKGSTANITVHYLSILYRYIPVGVNSDILYYGLIVYCVISILFSLIFLYTAIAYRKTAKIPDIVSYGISIYLSTLEHLLQPFASSVVGEVIVNLIVSPPNNYILPVILIIVSFFCCLIYIYIESSIFAHSIYFKPDSIQFVSGDNKLYFVFSIILINLILTAATKLPFIPKVILYVIGIGLYVFSMIVSSYGASFVKIKQQSHFSAYCLTGVVGSIVAIVLSITGKRGDMFYLICVIGVLFLSLLLKGYFTNKHQSIYLTFLDSLEDNEPEEINMSVKKYLMTIVAGFNAAHPVCISFKCFEIALDAWQDNITILSSFAKFIAIYPECTKRLAAIQNRLFAVGSSNKTVRQLVHQIITIVDQRENIVSPSLKKKINVAQKKINIAKRKIQNIWDFVIQSNIPEMGPAVSAAYKAVKNADMELLKLKSAFPNNTMVSRLYFKFLLEVKHNLAGSMTEQEVMRRLRRGELAVPDRVHELGVSAFPNMPYTIASNASEKILTVELSESEIVIDDDSGIPEVEENIHMTQKINSFRLPSIKETIIGSICVSVIVSIAPIVLLMAFNSLYMNDIYVPVEHMKAISALRALNFQIASSMTRIALEEFTHNFEPLYPPDYIPVNLNNSKLSRDHLATFITTAGETTAKVNDMRDFQKSNKNMNKVRNILFTNSIDFYHYRNSSSFEEVKMSGVNILIDTALQGSRFLSAVPITDEMFEKTEFLNPRLNAEYTGMALSEALTIFDTYVVNQCTRVQNILVISQITYSVIAALIYAGVIWHSIVKTEKETEEVYIALTLLPKNVVSHTADAIRSIKRESTSASETTSNQESNKQEETIIKVFMSANENTQSNSLMNAGEISTAVVAVIASLIAVNFLIMLYSQQYQKLLVNAPHLDYIMGTSAYMYGSLLNLNTIAICNSYKVIDNTTVHIERFRYRIGRFRDFYNSMRYGGSTKLENPFNGFKEAVDIANGMLSCVDDTTPPENLLEAFPCYDAESQFILFAILSRRVSEPYIEKYIDKTFTGTLDPETDLRVENEYLNMLWTLGPIAIYDTFVKPLNLILEDTIKEEMSKDIADSFIISAVMAIIVILSTVILILLVKELENRIRFFLSLILHIDNKVITSTNKIMSILNGNILSTDIDTSSRGAEFYEEVVDKLINGVVVVDDTNKIMSMNALVMKIFTNEGENLIGKDISALFDSRFGGEISEVIDKSNTTGGLVTFKSDSYQITKSSAKQSTIFNIKNETARINHSKLIAEERAKSDMMLSSILPSSLVPRVQAGEKNISFAVQSASVLFLDIVSFTPWCGSHDAAYVMKTLNMLFKMLDNAIKDFPLMTKVKCIGDCYMAAGGIFAEINQPAAHANQCVEFGLRAIEVIEKLNKENGEKLQIRVGVNTGGPIVAGVIGTGKPTFEIIGPAINMAQQMEHHGVPMNVHVSRATYELIYGSSFNIKERGQIEVKNGQVNTYLVTNK